MKEKNLEEKKREEASNSLKDNSFLLLNCYNNKMRKLNVLIAGSTGYIGVQLIKLLVKHKYINIKFLCGNSSIGKNISYYDTSLRKFKLPKIIKFRKELLKNIDLIFTALPNGEAQKISNDMNSHNIMIDLAADFRLKSALEYKNWYKQKHKSAKNIKKSIYSLPEIIGEGIKKYKIISCPGCYPTSILLPLIPLIKNKLIKTNNIIIDSKSGYSGAGRGIHKKYKNKNLHESLSVYGINIHRHNPEIKQELKKYSHNKINFTFTPHLVPMFRGILTNIYVELKPNITTNKIEKILSNFYKNEKFIKIIKNNKLLSTNNVINTNYCHISVNKTKDENKIIILSAIDNLIKGGAGQGIQNMNIKFNFKKNEGLI